ncbi:Uncharacterized protein Fot_06164 [Forsythia ovata]|uniref:Uncharacterized protein n=1 Tax=Forsythia ovata TaxID=205694 RepID=A0ABD1WWA8_9LAMI
MERQDMKFLYKGNENQKSQEDNSKGLLTVVDIHKHDNTEMSKVSAHVSKEKAMPQTMVQEPDLDMKYFEELGMIEKLDDCEMFEKSIIDFNALSSSSLLESENPVIWNGWPDADEFEKKWLECPMDMEINLKSTAGLESSKESLVGLENWFETSVDEEMWQGPWAFEQNEDMFGWIWNTHTEAELRSYAEDVEAPLEFDFMN